MAKITIFGLSGTGKTTTGKLLAEKIGYEYLSTGSMYREMASELGLTLSEFEAVASKTKDYDLKLDNKVAEYGKNHDNFIFESRLAWFFIPDSVKICLECDFEERIKRISQREEKSIDLAKSETIYRDTIIKDKYKEYYQIEDYADIKNFDFTVNTGPNNPEKVVEIILTELRTRGILQ